jgi:hypothetical protein
MARYRVLLQGIDYPPNKRAEVGDIVEDLPATSIKWLTEIGAIEDADKPAKAKIEEPVVEPIEEEPVVKAPVGFKADAKDGDKDGFVQDGTPHQRPVEETE